LELLAGPIENVQDEVEPEDLDASIGDLRDKLHDLLVALRELQHNVGFVRIDMILFTKRTLDLAALEICDTCFICLFDFEVGTEVPSLTHGCLRQSRKFCISCFVPIHFNF